jgi:hypothetical protein
LWSTRAQSEVFPLDFEPILREDGAQKNGCERSAAKRLCQALSERYHDLSILLVEDALFANAPHGFGKAVWTLSESSFGPTL